MCVWGDGMSDVSLIILVLVFFAVMFVFQSIRVVPQGYQETVERFGRYTRTLAPGLHIIIPLADRIGARVSVMETVVDVPSQDVITRDNAAVTVDGVVFYQILDCARATYEVHNLEVAILNLTMTNIRTVMGSMDLDELLSNREVINSRLLRVLDEATGPWGTKLTRVEIKDIRPPEDLVGSMARQMKAEREKRASILEAEGVRQSMILEAEGRKESAVLTADGLRQSIVLEAEGRLESAKREAEARERLGAAEAKVTEILANSVKENGQSALNYLVAQKYIEAFGRLAESPNQKLVLMPMETSSMIGSLAGITELVKDSLSSQSDKTKK